MIIYKITNLINNKIYIGKSKYNNLDYYGSGMLINFAIKKYGKENFKREILCECSLQEELNEMERYWIQKLNATNKKIGYNKSVGGDGGSYGPLTEKHKQKLRGKIPWNKGKKFGPLTEEHKQKISEKLKGRIRPKRSKEWCKNISRGKKGTTPWNKGKNWENPRMWINNGIKDKFILIKERKKYSNWKDGRLYVSNPNKSVTKGRIWINKNGETKMIVASDLNYYLNNFWKLGRKEEK